MAKHGRRTITRRTDEPQHGGAMPQRGRGESIIHGEFQYPDSAVLDTNSPVNSSTDNPQTSSCDLAVVAGGRGCADSLCDVVGFKLNLFCVEPDASKLVHAQTFGGSYEERGSRPICRVMQRQLNTGQASDLYQHLLTQIHGPITNQSQALTHGVRSERWVRSLFSEAHKC